MSVIDTDLMFLADAPDARGAGAPDHVTNDPDWGLIAAMGRGDQTALATFYRKHHGRLQRFIARVTRDPGGVDDIINETMLVVWDKAAVTVPQSRATTWMLGIAYRKALKSVTRTTRQAEDSMDDDEDGGTRDLSDDALPQRELEASDVFATALEALSPDQRAVMALVYQDGLGYSEIALALACPENTVKTRMFHARRKLRALWPQLMGSAPAAHGGSR